MNATPGAKDEYSRATQGSSAASGPFRPGRAGRLDGRSGARLPGSEAIRGGPAGLILGGALLGSLLLLVAEFTTLYQVHVASTSTPIKSVTGGSNHSYALVPIALAAALMAFAAVRRGSRPALLAIGLLGIVALLIALLGDLPDAQASGLAGSAATRYLNASSTPSAGLYMETLGAVLLIAASGLGFLMLGPPARAPRRRADGAGDAGESGSPRPGAGRDPGAAAP